MADYIDRETVLKILEEHPAGTWRGYDVYSDDVRAIMRKVDEQPAADVAPVRRGEWEETDLVEPDWHGFGTVRIPNGGLRCSRCANVFSKKLLWKENYCPNCGAKMEVQNEYPG